MFIALSHWSGSKPLPSALPLIMGSLWSSSWISCPVSWRSCSFGSVGLSLSHTLTVHRRGGYWGCQPIAQVLGLGGCWVGQLVGSPTQSAVRSGGCSPAPRPLGGLTHTHTIRAGSTVFPRKRSGSSFPIAVGGIEGGRGRVNFTALTPSGLVHPHPGQQGKL